MKINLFKKHLVIIICMLLCFGSGVVVSYFILRSDSVIQVLSSEESDSKKVEQENTNIIKQENFDSWVSEISTIELDGYTFNSELSYMGMSTRIMEKELSFDKREILTKSGLIDFQEDISTEKTVVFTNGTKVFTAAFMINDQYIGNDFQGSDWYYTHTDSIYSVPLVMSYKNIIILTTLQDSENFIDYYEAIDLSTIIIEKIKNDLL